MKQLLRITRKARKIRAVFSISGLLDCLQALKAAEKVVSYLHCMHVACANYAVSEEVEIEFPIEILYKTFDNIKIILQHPEEKPFYKGFSIIQQSIAKYRAHIKYAGRLRILGITKEEIQAILSLFHFGNM